MSANTSLFTDYYYSFDIEKNFYSTVSNLDARYENNLYVYLSALKNWEDEFVPPEPENSEFYFKTIKKNIFALKKITLSDTCPVIERIDWKANSHFDVYTDKEYLFNKDVNGNLIKKFYVRNCLDQVFKCLWNNQNTSNTHPVLSITKESENFVKIQYSIYNDFGEGSYIRLQDCNPPEFNGVYKTGNTSYNFVNVVIGDNEKFKMSANIANTIYVSGGTIKSLELTSDEPYFNVGTFNRDRIIKTSDGYKWKYIYTIDKGRKQKFFDRNWMPVVPKERTEDSGNESFGTIEVINVIDGGHGYANGIGTIGVNITGDGRDAFGTSYVIDSKLDDIYMENVGRDYTYANVSLIGSNTSSAVLDFSISPPGGHGFDPMYELGCKNFMLFSQFIGSENGKLPVDISYRQLGLLANPYESVNSSIPANNFIYSVDTKLLITNESGTFLNDELIYQSNINDLPDINTANCTATCLSAEQNTFVRIVNVNGNFIPNYPIFGSVSGASAMLLQIEQPNIKNYSGKVLYIENRVGIERDLNDSELFRLVINY